MIQQAIKCGFKDCNFSAVEELEVDLPETKFLSQLCSKHVMQLLRIHESELEPMITKGEIKGIRK